MKKLIRDYSSQIRKETDLDDFIFAVENLEVNEAACESNVNRPQ